MNKNLVIERSRDFIKVLGPDALSFLQGQLSQDVESVEPSSSKWSFLLEPSGKVVAWLRITCLGKEEFLLDMDSGFAELVKDRLSRFLIRTKCTLEVSPMSMVTYLGPESETPKELKNLVPLLMDWPNLKALDYISSEKLEIAEIQPKEVWDQFRVIAGIPAMGTEITDKTIPAATGQIERSVSFTKGCYTGQELVARVDSRNAGPPKHLVILDGGGDPPAPGIALSHEGSEVIEITSSTKTESGFCALGYRHRSNKEINRINYEGFDIEVKEI